MKYEAILHIPLSQYAFGLSDARVVFRLRAARGDLKRCTLIYADRSCRSTPVDYYRRELDLVRRDSLFDWWEIMLDTPVMRICYGFQLEDFAGESTLYYGDRFHQSLTDERFEYFQLPYNHRADRADIPKWLRDSIVYNVFPDSFASAGNAISCRPSQRLWQGEAVRGRLGGTLRGITESLPYLQDMGFDLLYINPVFAAGEYHKYDVIDYFHIDPVFGTDEDFKLLVRDAHAMGIRVMIDGVFNHAGWKSEFFRDAVKNGRASRYWDWFYRLAEPVAIPEDMEEYPAYECFGYERMMPKLATDHPAVSEYFCRVGVHWVEKYDIDGWRLDVASEVNDGFWRAFRSAVKAVKPDCALIGEVWETASHWLDGSMFDSTMNYDFRRHCRKFFAEDAIDAQEFDSRVTDMLMRYRSPIAYAQLNLLDSHDVSRFFSLCGESLSRMKLAVLFQMSFVGMPSVFYGDEKGICGITEDEYRRPMLWDNQEGELQAFYRKAIALRRQHSPLRRGSFHTVSAEAGCGIYHYLRRDACETVGFLLNRSSASAQASVPGEILWQEQLQCGILGAYGFVVYIR